MWNSSDLLESSESKSVRDSPSAPSQAACDLRSSAEGHIMRLYEVSKSFENVEIIECAYLERTCNLPTSW